MALVHQATCPTCGQVHMVSGMRSVYAGPAIEVCGECVEQEVRLSAQGAREDASNAAFRRFPQSGWPLANKLVDGIAFNVLLRHVCAGKTEVETLRNIERFWKEVQKEVES